MQEGEILHVDRVMMRCQYRGLCDIDIRIPLASRKLLKLSRMTQKNPHPYILPDPVPLPIQAIRNEPRRATSRC
jgi:hypothetical protein